MKKEEIFEIFDRFDDPEERSRYLRAKRRVDQIKGFFIHLIIFLVIASAHFIKEYIENQHIDYKHSLGILLWGVAVLIHSSSVYLPSFFLGKDWEEKKIKELSDQYKKETNYND